MFRTSKLAVPLALLVGAAGGWLAASGQLAAMFRATPAQAQTAASAGDEPAACCDSGCRAQYVSHLAAQEKNAKSSKKPNIVIIWGDDIGQSNLSAYTRGL